ncbi:NADH dehydrogenase [ubiquinone] iron-sulfur protein 4, mitochondrial-like [Anabrus simplex]|uniref:NADH dehydrogenase [ubiquinone] iron-sulfur protein 4, mitochondrial-like n=1 Tax=Anabrus simplex TaxID=316456 RepID=UPI0035A274DE
MTSLILRSGMCSLRQPFLKMRWANISTSAARYSDDIDEALEIVEAPRLDNKYFLMKREEICYHERLKEYITVDQPMKIAPFNGVPEEHVKSRLVRIYMPPKHAMQQGTNHTHVWEMEFETRARWENPLMGWSSSGDPLSNMKVKFDSKEEAIDFCEKNGWPWYVAEPPKKKPRKPKNYGVNFAFGKRTRVSTK